MTRSIDLDSLLDQLEEHWQLTGNSNLTELLPTILGIADAGCLGKAWTELCAVDLEWQWRKWARSQYTPMSVSQYCALRPDVLPTQSELEILWDSEWIARSVWGDTPGCDRFHEMSGKIKSSEYWSSRLDEVSPLEVEVSLSKSRLIERPGSYFFVGRQKEEEPTPPHWHSAKKKIVAWNLENVTISRTLLSVRRTKIRQIEILNPSTKMPLMINDQSIPPASAKRFALPLLFAAEGTQLLFRCAEGHRR